MALTLPKLPLPKLEFSRNQILYVVGGVVVLGAAGWFGWQYFADAGPAPTAKPQPAAAAKQTAAKAAAPASPAPAQKTAATASAAETVAVAEAQKPAEAQPAATPAPQQRRLPAANQDLRKCLDLESNAAIIKCAQP